MPRHEIEFVPGDVLLPCPFCGWVCDGLNESELWRHFYKRHDGVAKMAGAAAATKAFRQEMSDAQMRRSRRSDISGG